jgi:hypothetical protein
MSLMSANAHSAHSISGQSQKKSTLALTPAHPPNLHPNVYEAIVEGPEAMLTVALSAHIRTQLFLSA